MKSSLFIILITFFCLSFCNAQMILNAESLRVDMLKGQNQWSGTVGLSLNFTKNVNEVYNFNTNVALGYNGGENLWMIISNLNFNKAEGVAFQNSGVQHLRYNREISKRFTIEAFLQGQYDEVSEIDFRGLAGLGPRFELTKKKNEPNTSTEKDEKQRSRLFLGTLVMYEYEKSLELDSKIIHRDFRSSNYLSFSFYPTDNVTIISTTYYQPRVDKLKDYRVSSEINFVMGFSSKKESASSGSGQDELKKGFWDKLELNINFSYNYDAFPVISIPKTQYSISNGLSYTL